jgi:hypothetical protein
MEIPWRIYRDDIDFIEVLKVPVSTFVGFLM